MRQQVLDVEAELTSLQLADTQDQLAAAEVQAGTPKAAAQPEEVAEEEPLAAAREAAVEQPAAEEEASEDEA